MNPYDMGKTPNLGKMIPGSWAANARPALTLSKWHRQDSSTENSLEELPEELPTKELVLFFVPMGAEHAGSHGHSCEKF